MLKQLKQANMALKVIVAALAVANALIWGNAAQALVSYPPGALLQPNDVTSSHIRDNTIVDVDINTSAQISATKISSRGAIGTVLVTDGTNIATTTTVKIATSTADLYVFGGRIHATSTNFGGVNYSWPSAQGTTNTLLQNDGSGNLSWSTGASKLAVSLTTDEALNTSDAVVVADGLQTVTRLNPTLPVTGLTAFGRVAAQTKLAQSIQETSAITISGLEYYLAKSGTPTDNSIVSIQTSTGGLPSGTTLMSWTIANGSLTGTAVTYDTFAATTTLAANTQYWIVWERSGIVDFTNYPATNYNAGDTYGSQAQFNGTAWSIVAGTRYPFKLIINSTPGNVAKASAATTTTTSGFIGMVAAAAATSTSASINVSGIATGFSGLTVGKQYYLSDTSGAISTSVGTVTKKACISLSATSCLINNI